MLPPLQIKNNTTHPNKDANSAEVKSRNLHGPVASAIQTTSKVRVIAPLTFLPQPGLSGTVLLAGEVKGRI